MNPKPVLQRKKIFSPSFRKVFGQLALSSLLLTLAFPKVDWWLLAWVGLIPLLIVLDGRRPAAAFGLAYLSGVLFFGGTLYWFIHVTILGAILLVLVLAFYYGIFGWAYTRFSKRKLFVKLLVIPSVWVGLEYLRAHLFTGFGWASLGYSQYKNFFVNQIADVTGVYGVSFLVVMVNVWLKEIWQAHDHKKRFTAKEFLSSEGKFVIGILISCVVYSYYRLSVVPLGDSIRVTVVQGNIPQSVKWEPRAWPSIMEKHLFLTRQATHERPVEGRGPYGTLRSDLIIWPETAFPGFRWQDPRRFESLKEFVAEQKIPLLLGLITGEGQTYYNSAMLISENGEVIEQYNKLHLVPFGEYIPFRKNFPFLEDIVPIDDFTAGGEYTVFTLGPPEKFKNRPNKFATVICFEDGVSEIARRFVQKGADFLINITNDAWFWDTKAPFMHLQSSVFRAIENRRAVIRSANTGVSCFIDSWGRISNFVQEATKKTFVSGVASGRVRLSREDALYTKLGDIFTYLCFGCILWGIISKKVK